MGVFYTYYKITIETWSYDWERSEVYFSKTKEDAENKKNNLLNRLVNSNKRGYIEEISFDDLKQCATLEDIEELFDINVYESDLIDFISKYK